MFVHYDVYMHSVKGNKPPEIAVYIWLTRMVCYMHICPVLILSSKRCSLYYRKTQQRLNLVYVKTTFYQDIRLSDERA